MEGDWQLVEKQLEVDGCQLVPPDLRGDPCQLSCDSVTVVPAEGSAWEMHFVERGGVAQCLALPSGGFECLTEDIGGPPDAQVRRIDFMEGQPQPDGSVQGVFALEMVCSGPGCPLMPAFAEGNRCESRGSFRGERRSGF